MTSAINSYLTFKIGEETFGLSVAKVMEIREYREPKSLPQTLPFVVGVIQYQDEIIPLIDTGIKFGMNPIIITPSTCTVVLQLVNDIMGKSYRVAILVDAVSDVFESEDSQLKSIIDDYRPTYIAATYLNDDKYIYILNPDTVFNQKEIITMLDAIGQIK
jgi:purine-binding chemotaxis protein CheW